MGTHVLENKIGTIRSLSFQDKSAMKLIQTAPRHDFIKTLSKSNNDIKRTRLNQEGVRLNLGIEDIDFRADPDSISMLLLAELKFLEEFPDSIDIPTFSENIEIFVKTRPYELNISYSSTKSAKTDSKLSYFQTKLILDRKDYAASLKEEVLHDEL